MDYQPRTIALVVELLHPPVGNDPRQVQRLHNELFEAGQPAYAGFQVTPLGPVLSNPTNNPGSVSQVAFLPDRVQFREERGGMTHETFAERVRTIAGRAAELRNMPLFAAQTVVIRSLINPRTASDTRVFLRDRMLGLGDAAGVFGRPTELVGLRLALGNEAPALYGGEASGTGPADGQGNYGIRIESWQQDARSIFIEVAGTFGPTAPGPGVAGGEGYAALEENVLSTYAFLEDRVLPFVARFDRRAES